MDILKITSKLFKQIDDKDLLKTEESLTHIENIPDICIEFFVFIKTIKYELKTTLDENPVILKLAVLNTLLNTIASHQSVSQQTIEELEKKRTAYVGQLAKVGIKNHLSENQVGTFFIVFLEFGKKLSIMKSTSTMRGMIKINAQTDHDLKKNTESANIEDIITEIIKQLSDVAMTLAYKKNYNYPLITSLYCCLSLHSLFPSFIDAIQFVEIIRRLYQEKRNIEELAAAFLLYANIHIKREMKGNVIELAELAQQHVNKNSILEKISKKLINDTALEELKITSNNLFVNYLEISLRDYKININYLLKLKSDYPENIKFIKEALIDLSSFQKEILLWDDAVETEKQICELNSKPSDKITLKNNISDIRESQEIYEATELKINQIYADTKNHLDETLSSINKKIKQCMKSEVTRSINFFSRIWLPKKYNKVALIIPVGNWKLISLAKDNYSINSEYVLLGEGEDDWSKILTINKINTDVNNGFQSIKENFKNLWLSKILNAKFQLIENKENFVTICQDQNVESCCFTIEILDDIFIGSRLLKCQIIRSKDELFMFLLETRGALEYITNQLHALETIEMKKILIDDNELNVENILKIYATAESNVMKVFHNEVFVPGKSELIKRLFWFRNLCKNAIFKRSYCSISNIISQCVNSPSVISFYIDSLDDIRRRFDLIPEGTSSGLNFEEFIISLSIKKSPKISPELYIKLFIKMIQNHTDSEGNVWFLRVIKLINLSLPGFIPNFQNKEFINLIMNCRNRAFYDFLSNERHEDIVNMDLELLLIIGKADWGYEESVKTEIIFSLYHKIKEIIEHHNLDQYYSYRAEIILPESLTGGRLVHRAFFAKPLKELLGGKPLCHFIYDSPLHIYYFRPLDSSNDLYIKNQFPSELSGMIEKIPGKRSDEGFLSLESILSVGLPSTIQAIGGTVDNLGALQFFHLNSDGDDNWKNIVGGYLSEMSTAKINNERKAAKIIIFVPSASEGVLWEMEQILEKNLLDLVYFIMPPEEAIDKSEYDWESYRHLWKKLNFPEFPNYNNDGCFFRWDEHLKNWKTYPFSSIWNGNFHHTIRNHANLLAEKVHYSYSSFLDLV